MTVHLVVPGEERAVERPRVLGRAEARGELRLVLEGLELRLAVRIVVARMGPAVAPLDAEVGQDRATGSERIELPRSACTVSWPEGTPCVRTDSAMSRPARAALSRVATIQPGTQRLKMSRITCSWYGQDQRACSGIEVSQIVPASAVTVLLPLRP